MTDQCSTCFYGQRTQTFVDVTLRACCRDNPIYDEAMGNLSTSPYIWPSVEDTDWCGRGADKDTGISFNSLVENAMSWKSYTPVATTKSGTITSYTASGKYSRAGDTVSFNAVVHITTIGTGADALYMTLPVSTSALTSVFFGWSPNKENSWAVAHDGTGWSITQTGLFTPSDGDEFWISGTYQVT